MQWDPTLVTLLSKIRNETHQCGNHLSRISWNYKRSTIAVSAYNYCMFRRKKFLARNTILSRLPIFLAKIIIMTRSIIIYCSCRLWTIYLSLGIWCLYYLASDVNVWDHIIEVPNDLQFLYYCGHIWRTNLLLPHSFDYKLLPWTVFSYSFACIVVPNYIRCLQYFHQCLRYRAYWTPALHFVIFGQVRNQSTIAVLSK